jgi:hypothetical protein
VVWCARERHGGAAVLSWCRWGVSGPPASVWRRAERHARTRRHAHTHLEHLAVAQPAAVQEAVQVGGSDAWQVAQHRWRKRACARGARCVRQARQRGRVVVCPACPAGTRSPTWDVAVAPAVDGPRHPGLCAACTTPRPPAAPLVSEDTTRCCTGQSTTHSSPTLTSTAITHNTTLTGDHAASSATAPPLPGQAAAMCRAAARERRTLAARCNVCEFPVCSHTARKVTRPPVLPCCTCSRRAPPLWWRSALARQICARRGRWGWVCASLAPHRAYTLIGTAFTT